MALKARVQSPLAQGESDAQKRKKKKRINNVEGTARLEVQQATACNLGALLSTVWPREIVEMTLTLNLKVVC